MDLPSARRGDRRSVQGRARERHTGRKRVDELCRRHVRAAGVAEADRVDQRVAGRGNDPVDLLVDAAVELSERRGVKVALVALANKMARVVWALLAHGRSYVPVWSNGTTRPA